MAARSSNGSWSPRSFWPRGARRGSLDRRPADRAVTAELRHRGPESEFLPRIVRGECFFGIGMSEPDSGSDLASVRTRADRGRRRLGTDRHQGLDLRRPPRATPSSRSPAPHRRPGSSARRAEPVHRRPARARCRHPARLCSMNGAHHFNEVILDGVVRSRRHGVRRGRSGLAAGDLGARLRAQRPGAIPVDVCVARRLRGKDVPAPDPARPATSGGWWHASPRCTRCRPRSRGALEREEPADTPAAVVKVLGTATEGDIAEFAHLSTDHTADRGFSAIAETAVDQRPGFTLRGGTNEILRGVIARGLGIR